MIRITLVLLLGVCAIACNQTEEITKEIIVTGQIENAKNDSIVFEFNDEIKKFPVGADGLFTGRFDGQTGFYPFTYFRESSTCFLSPGDSLHISFNTREFDESMSYSGSAANENNYLAAKMLLKEKMRKTTNTRTLYTMPEDSFMISIKQSEDSVLSLLDKKDVSEKFKNIETKNIKYESMTDMSNYELYHSYYIKNDEFKVSDSFRGKLENMDYTNEADFISIPAYREFVIGYYSGDELPDKIEELASVKSLLIREKSVQQITQWLSPGTENLKERIDEMKAIIADEDLIQSLTDKYETFKNLTKGNLSPRFEFKNVSDKPVALEDLKGKNVYIDVWATWCGPCKVEIPFLKELESEYHDKNIEFVSISVDVPKDEKKWKDMVAEKELKGVQLMSDNGWDTDFVKGYKIRGIPRFILLDSEGRIVTADAPRPSSKSKIREMIDQLLIEA